MWKKSRWVDNDGMMKMIMESVMNESTVVQEARESKCGKSYLKPDRKVDGLGVWAGGVEQKDSKTSNSHRSCPILVEEERENDAMIDRSMLRGGVGESRDEELLNIVRRRVGEGDKVSVGNSSIFHV
jgi:hypothetical protein